jgi:hypothetical protein
MVGRPVQAGLIYLRALAVHLTADRVVQVDAPFELLVDVRVCVAVMRDIVQDLLPERLIPFPVCHHGVVELAGRAQFFVKAHVFDR